MKIHLNPSAIEQLAGVSVSYASIKSTLKVKMTLQKKSKKCLCIKDGLFLILKIPGVVNRTQSNSIELNRTHTHKKMYNRTQLIERSIFELLIFHNFLEVQVTLVYPGVWHVFLVNAEIPEKWLQMRCGL